MASKPCAPRSVSNARACGDRAGKPVEQVSLLRVGLREPRLEQPEDEPIGDEPPCAHEVLRAPAGDAAGAHGVTQQLTSRDVRDAERLAQHLALRPLARPRRSDEEQSHVSGP